MVYREMNLYVYDKKFNLIGIVDKYVSLIWSDRYAECGSFELALITGNEYTDILKKGNFCRCEYSDRWCIIEKIETHTENDYPTEVIYSGRSIESLIGRRVVAKKTEFENKPKSEEETLTPEEQKVNMQESIKKLFDENIIEPEDKTRQIPNFTFKMSDNRDITKIKFKETYDGDNILEVVQDICEDKHLGFKLILDEDFKFVFEIYKGNDLTQDELSGNYVIFSPFYDNLKTSEYFTTDEEYCNVMYVSKENETKLEVNNFTDETIAGIDRRECHEDVSSLKENQDNDLTDDQIKIKAKKKLNFDYRIKTGFEGDIVPGTYEYGKDYNVGDKVRFQDIYGNDERVWIGEVVIAFDENGLTILPTFEEIDWDETKENEEDDK